MVPQSNDGGPRSRTRRAILDAAMAVLAQNPTASLGDIAAAADVGRSTLHRYFAERSDLLRALARHVHALSNAAIEHAEPDCGPPVEALRRVVECQLDLGPIVPFIYNEPTITSDPELAAELDTGDEVIVEVLNRAACQGSAGTARLATTGVLGAAARRLRGREAQQRSAGPDRRRHHGQPHRRHHQPEPAMSQRLSPTFTPSGVTHVHPARRRADRPPHPRRAWVALAVLLLPVLLIAVDNTVLAFALPSIAEEFRPSASTQLWIVDVYSLVLAALLVMMGSLGDRVGRRRMLMIGASGFAVVSAAAAFAPSAGYLVAARAVLGVFGAMLMPSTLSLIRNIFVDASDASTRHRDLGLLLHRRARRSARSSAARCCSTSIGARCSSSPCRSCCRCWCWRPVWSPSRVIPTRARSTRSACCCR